MVTILFWVLIFLAVWLTCGIGALYVAKYVDNPSCADADDLRFLLFAGPLSLIGVTWVFLGQWINQHNLWSYFSPDILSKRVAVKIANLVGYKIGLEDD